MEGVVIASDHERSETTAEQLWELCREFEAAEDATRPARILAERDRDYYDEKQITPEEEAELKRRGQPVVVFNRIKRKINAMQGLEKQTRKDPKAFPRNPDDEDAARAATDALRYVVETMRWDDKRSEAGKELAIEGTCAVKIGVKDGKQGKDPTLSRVSWDRFYYDHHAREFDFADARFMGEVVWMDLDAAVRKFPDAKEALTETWRSSQGSDTYDDTPKHSMWADYRRKRVRLCEHYYNDGGWKFCIFTKGGFVVEPQDSPYIGAEGEPECPIKAVSLYIDRDNNRYGEVRTMIGPQDEINKRRSKGLHLISQRQVRVSPVVSQDPNAIRKELSRPDGVFVGEQGDVEILPTSDMAAANLQLLQEAKAEIDLLGVNAALAGKNEQQMSGRAIMAQQQGGMVEAATYLDRIKTLSLAVYRSIWARIQQYWTEERWIRVTDDERNLRFVGLNRQITLLDLEAEKAGINAQNFQQQPPEVQQQFMALAQDPRSRQMVKHNSVAELDVDIIVDEGIDTPTVQAEQFDTIVKMIPALGPMGQSPEVLKLVIQASSLREKDKLLGLFDQQQADPNAAVQAQMQAAQQQAQMEAQVEIEKAQIAAQADIQVATIKAEADSQIKHQQLAVDAQIKQAAAETDAQIAERKMMLDAELKARVADATGETQRKQAEADKQANDTQAQMAIMAQLAQVLSEMNRPKLKIPVRDENGFITAMREVTDSEAA